MRVESENVRTGEVIHTSTAYLTMVALDDEGAPTGVPAVAPETPDEVRRASARRSCAATTRLARARADRGGAQTPGARAPRPDAGARSPGFGPACSAAGATRVILPLRIV